MEVTRMGLIRTETARGGRCCRLKRNKRTVMGDRGPEGAPDTGGDHHDP